MLLARSNSQRELNPFCFRRSYFIPFDPYRLSSRMNAWERYEITGGSVNKGWLQIQENKYGNQLPLPLKAVTHSSTYIGRCILYQMCLSFVNKCSRQVKLWVIIIILMSCRHHGYPWPSLATSPYCSSPLEGLQGYIPYPHIAAVCMYVRAGHPAFARPYVGVHRSTSLMSSSLLLQQCPACLVLRCLSSICYSHTHPQYSSWD